MSDSPTDFSLPPSLRIQDMPESDRPREKMMRHGPDSLTDAELLAIFFGSGVVGMSAVGLGRMFIERYGGLHALSRLTVEELCTHKGIGEAKAIHLAAAFALGKRLARLEYDGKPMSSAAAILSHIGPELRAEPQEVLKILLLNTRLSLIGVEEVTRGSLNETIAHPRDILHHVIRRRAHGFAVAHNHPAGDPSPSTADRTFTRRLREAAEIMQVAFVDHIIVGLPSSAHAGYFSFRENGLL